MQRRCRRSRCSAATTFRTMGARLRRSSRASRRYATRRSRASSATQYCFRPRWSIAGAEFVADVAPYENMKLRLLNGSHSALAYLGYLAGYETVSDTMKDPAYRRLAEGVMDDAATTLKMPPGANVAAYKRALLERYANPAPKHRTWQICMDG